MPGPTAAISRTQRDWRTLAVDEYGWMNWRNASGYNKRSKVEAAIGRYKRVIGDTMKSRHDDRRATEAAIAVEVINQMNEFRRANLFEWHDRSRLDVQTCLAKAPCNKVLLGVKLFQKLHAKVRPDGAAGRSTRLFKTPDAPIQDTGKFRHGDVGQTIKASLRRD